MNNPSVKKNYLYNVVYEILLVAIPLITSPYISRVIGAEGVGIYSYSITMVNYFVLFSRMGIVNHGSRAVAACKTIEEKSMVFSNVFVIQSVLGIFSLMAYAIYLFLFVKANLIIAVISGIYLMSAIFDINWYFYGLEKFSITVSRNIIVKVVCTILMFVIVKSPEDLGTYVFILAFGNLAGQSLVWFNMRNNYIFTKPLKSEIKEQIKPIVLLFIPTIAVSMYKMMDKIMLGNMADMTSLGYYEYASSIIALPLGFITSLGTVMMPRMSALLTDGKKELSDKYMRYSFAFVSFMSVAFMFGLAGISPTFIPLYLGTDYSMTSDLLIGLSSTLIFISWANVVRTQYLLPQKRDKEYIISLISGAVVNLFVNYLLIPRMASFGAVIGTICAEVCVCLIQVIEARREIHFRGLLIENLPFIAIGAAMFGVVRLVSKLNMNSWAVLAIQVLVGVLVYAIPGILYVKKMFDLKFKTNFKK